VTPPGSGGITARKRRPYADTSPFNTRIESPEVKPNSDAIIERLTAHAPSYFVAGDQARDWGVAIYYPAPDDTSYRIHCVEPWGTSEIEGDIIRLPAGAKPSGVWPLPHPGDDWDSHLTVIQDGVEYDLWNIRTIGAGEIVCKWGGKTDIDGDGLGSGAVAAEFGALGGLIRAHELVQGRINHALSLTVPCTVGYTWPATKGGYECSWGGFPLANALQQGDLIQLQISRGDIQQFPVWKQGILKAWKRYGAYVGDTTGDPSQWALKVESAASYTSQGQSDPLVELAKSEGLHPEDYNGNGQPEYWFDIGGGVDWRSRLRVVKP
jgi:hypothetical protein